MIDNLIVIGVFLTVVILSAFIFNTVQKNAEPEAKELKIKIDDLEEDLKKHILMISHYRDIVHGDKEECYGLKKELDSARSELNQVTGELIRANDLLLKYQRKGLDI